MGTKKGQRTKRDNKQLNPSLLGLGDITKEQKELEALAAIFDLQGFTPFCNQTDFHLFVPKYLKSFLTWLFKSIFEKLITVRDGEQVVLGPLPFFAKFLGDGVLFLWKAKDVKIEEMASIVSALFEICFDYQDKFFPEVRKTVSKAPPILRCGIARGNVTPIGNNKDYVGFCINLAARLQKLEKFSFAFSQKGLDFERTLDEDWLKYFTLKRASIRGVGKDQLVYVLKSEFNALPRVKKKKMTL
jgi:hypothetical protein